jgi:hypothetical protein
MSINEIKNNAYKRPLGISIIALLNILKGMIGLITLFFLPGYVEQNIDNIEMVMEYAEWFMYLIIGIGISLGKRWAWWILVFSLTLSLFYNLFSLVIAKDILLEAGLSSSEITKYFYKLGASIIFQTILLVYLYQKSVFRFYAFNYSTIKKKLAIVFSINILLITFIIFNQLY